MPKRIQFYLSDEAAEILDTVENKSKFVNELITTKRRKTSTEARFAEIEKRLDKLEEAR